MEVVLGVVVATQAAILATDLFFVQRNSYNSSAASAAAPESSAPTPVEDGDSGGRRARILELESRLASLKTQAREANSPDSFVQYARLTREANNVEKELISLRGHDAATPTLPMLELLSSLIPAPRMVQNARASVLRRLLRFAPIVLLWIYFRFGTEHRGSAVLTADCDVFRPFAFLLNKVGQCEEGAVDAVCEAREICAISYQHVAIVASAVIGRVFVSIKGVLT